MRALGLILWFILIDVPLSLLRLLVAVAGPLVVLAALPSSRLHTGDHKPLYEGWEYRRLPALFRPWDNVDYGTMGNGSYSTKPYNPLFYKNPTGVCSQWYWLAIRNPANGLSSMTLFQCVQSKCDRVGYWGKPVIDNGKYGWQFVCARRGWRWFTGFYGYWPYTDRLQLELRIGFKILPTEPDRTRPVGMTFIPNPLKGL